MLAEERKTSLLDRSRNIKRFWAQNKLREEKYNGSNHINRYENNVKSVGNQFYVLAWHGANCSIDGIDRSRSAPL